MIVDGEKMSKSKGNFCSLRDLLNKGLSAEAIRYSLMNSHYRKQLNFTIEGINQSQSAIDRVNDLIFRLKDVNKTDADDSAVMKELEEANKNFFESIYDDLNVSEALGVFFSFIKSINISFDSINVSSRDAIIKFIERVNNIINCFNMNGEKEIESSEEEKINKLIEERTLAKKEKNYKRADEIRDELNSMGIEIMDTPNGVRWKRK